MIVPWRVNRLISRDSCLSDISCWTLPSGWPLIIVHAKYSFYVHKRSTELGVYSHATKAMLMHPNHQNHNVAFQKGFTKTVQGQEQKTLMCWVDKPFPQKTGQVFQSVQQVVQMHWKSVHALNRENQKANAAISKHVQRKQTWMNSCFDLFLVATLRNGRCEPVKMMLAWHGTQHLRASQFPLPQSHQHTNEALQQERVDLYLYFAYLYIHL